jgi:tripartite-type tricarboxylate transporter receptor subunit TctC
MTLYGISTIASGSLRRGAEDALGRRRDRPPTAGKHSEKSINIRLPMLRDAQVLTSGRVNSIAPTKRDLVMKRPHRRQFLHLAAGAAALPVVSQAARAQAYPSRAVRIIVGFTAGGAFDLTARLIGPWLSQRLGQQFIVENRPGGGTNIATEAVVRAPADGHTLLLCGAVNAINATLYEKLNFDFLRDLAPVASVIRFPNVIDLNPSFPAKTIPEFIAYAKTNRGKINMASSGNGTSQHLSGELFKMMTGVNLVHVPYRGAAQALTDLIGGQVQVSFDPLPPAIELIRSGKVRALAVTTAVRSDALPDVPTVGEFVPGYEASGWNGVVVPRNTPIEIIQKLNTEINAGLADPGIRAKLTDLGGMVLAGSAADFGKLIADEIDKWSKVIKFAGVKPD